MDWLTSDSMFYVYTDYLSSLRCITDATGKVKQRLGYDAWGNRRDPVTGAKLTIATGLMFARGFTGHEHLDEFGLINMNGRVYDPGLGMFISSDNYVQAPTNTQSYNRYAYCVNNPLMYSDPGGNIFFITPGISWSSQGGFGVSLSAGVGFQGGFSAQMTVGYDFSSHNFYATVGASYCYTTAYAGYGTKSGWFSGVGFGLSSHGFSSNAVSAGINYSQNGGWSANFSFAQFSNNGVDYSMSFSYSHAFPINDGLMSEDKFNALVANDPNTPKNADGSIDYTSANAKMYWEKFGLDKHVKKFYIGGEGTTADITYKDGLYSAIDASGSYVKAGGITDPIEHSNLSNVYLSLSSFHSEYQLYLVMGHESIHVHDYATGLMIYHDQLTTAKSEVRAYSWSLKQIASFRVPGDPYYKYCYNGTYNSTGVAYGLQLIINQKIVDSYGK